MPVVLDGDGYGPPTEAQRERQKLAKMTFHERKAHRIAERRATRREP